MKHRALWASQRRVCRLLALDRQTPPYRSRRREYNEERTHSAIGDVTPQEFITHYQTRAQLAQELTYSALV